MTWLVLAVRHPICALTGHYERHTGHSLSLGEKKDFTSDTATRIAGENETVSKRMTWLLTLQGFLFAAFGLSLGLKPNTLLVQGFRELVVLAGALSAILALVAILAAQSSINDLKGRWLAAVGYEDHAVPPFAGPVQSLGARVMTFGMCIVLVTLWGRLAPRVWMIASG